MNLSSLSLTDQRIFVGPSVHFSEHYNMVFNTAYHVHIFWKKMNDQLSISSEHRAKHGLYFEMAFPSESAIWQRNRQLIYSYKMRTWENLRWVVFLSPRTSVIYLQSFRCLLDGTRKVLGISLSLSGFWPARMPFIKCLERISIFTCFCYYCFRKP